MALALKSHPSSWIYKMVIAAWIVAIIAALLWQFRPAADKPPPPGWRNWKGIGSILATVITKDGVFVGGSRGLFHIITMQGSVKTIEIPGVKNPVMVWALLLDSEYVLWVGHDKGLSIRKGTDWKTLTRDDGLPDTTVRAIVRAKDGTVWLGTNNGVVRLNGRDSWNQNPMTILTHQDGLLHKVVSAIVEDHEGGMWFGNYAAPGGGVSRLKDKQWQYWTPKDGLPHANITSLMLDQEGRVWAGCGFMDRGGAAIFSRSSGDWRLEKTIPSKELAGPKVRSLFQDNKGRVWLGSENDGMAVRFGNKTLRILTVKDGLSAQEIMSIGEAKDNAIWLGTLDGVTRIGPEALASLFPQ
jgi:ligand-binding sensor domain-containing protein